MEKIPRLMSACLLLAASLLLAGCNDEAKLQKAAEIGNDGVAAAQAYSDYAQATAGILSKQCDLENFIDMLAYRRSKSSVQKAQQDMAMCAQDPDRQQTMAELDLWSQDALAMGKVYGALANFAGPGADQTISAAVNGLTSSVASAAKLHVSSGFGKALDALAIAIEDHQTAKGVEAFASAMANVPTQMAKILDHPDNAQALDSIYSDYDVDLRSAVEAAYANDVVNPDTTLEDFYATLGLQMPTGFQTDPYAIAFAQTLHPRAIAPLGAQERQKIVRMLQNLSKETAQLGALNEQRGSIRDQIDEIKSLRDRIHAVVDASDSAK